MNKLKRVRIKVKGIVQGVGFRPTVYRHAKDTGVTGFVTNTPEGVTIEAEGETSQLKSFIALVEKKPPAMSKITEIKIEDIALEYSSEFVIIKSKDTGNKDAEISPDIAVCPDCIKEILDPNNRRYLYPFTNCTNCGPRFTIVNDRPYDRVNTSMSNFEMCEACQQEYEDPNNRRFHAQPNACSKCGPSLYVLLQDGSVSDKEPLSKTEKYIKEGKLIAIKSIGGFNIACDPFNKEVVLRLREKKKRGSKSFALMMKDLDVVEKYCHISPAEKETLKSPKAPIVLLRKKNKLLDNISPDNNYLGVVLPYTPLHVLLFNNIDVLIMTSANRNDEPIAVSDSEVVALMNYGLIDVVLTHNRDIVNRCDDSIVQFIDEKMFLIRRARGFVPTGVHVGSLSLMDSLSLGADLKNTFSLRSKNNIFISQHIGDLEDLRNQKYQQQQIYEFVKLLDIKPRYINVDAHPAYFNYDRSDKRIYHHHAHALSAMAENGLLGKRTLGIVCDGTGYGKDGNIWGFEFLDVLEDYTKFNRLVHLDYFRLPGGERAINETDRIAISLLLNSGIKDLSTIDKARISIIEKLLKSNINCPLTSSLGRLFDGVSAICGICSISGYEAQSAIILQKVAEEFTGRVKDPYPVLFNNNTIDYRPMIKNVVIDIQNKVSVQEIAFKFHEWVCNSIIECIKNINPDRMVFSGGCFQNSLLVLMLSSRLEKLGIRDYYFNKDIPTNDGGISFGQAVV